eukprot:57922_1
MRECKLTCPYVGTCFGVRTGGIDSKRNKLLVIGFIKKCFEMTEFEYLQLPPVNIMMLIHEWLGVPVESMEMIHWIGEDRVDGIRNEHYAIYLKDILSNLIPGTCK